MKQPQPPVLTRDEFIQHINDLLILNERINAVSLALDQLCGCPVDFFPHYDIVLHTVSLLGTLLHSPQDAALLSAPSTTSADNAGGPIMQLFLDLMSLSAPVAAPIISSRAGALYDSLTNN